MTGLQTVVIGIRLLCVLEVAALFSEMPMLWIASTLNYPKSGHALVAIAFVVMLVAIIAVWRFSLPIAKALLPPPARDDATPWSMEFVLTAAFCVAGIFLLALAIPYAFNIALIALFTFQPDMPVQLTVDHYAAMVREFVRACLGLLFLFGAPRLVRLVLKFH